MRPVPSSKHILSIVIFLAYSLGCGYLAWQDDRLSEEQVHFATAAAKRLDPEGLKYDTVYGEIHADGRLGQIHTPVFLALMELSLIPTNYQDLMLPFRVGVVPFVFLYLCGMYALLWRQTRSSTISAFVAILSTAVISTFGNWFWGIGPLETITPQGVVIALSPLLLLTYLQNAQRPQVVLTFAAIGLCANVHLISAVNLALVLLAVHVGRNRCSWRSVVTALVGLVCFILGAAPYLLYFIALRRSVAVGAGDPPVVAQTVFEALRISGTAVLFPEMLSSLLNWGLYVAVLAIPAAILLWRIEQFRSRNIDLWLWMAGVAMFVALGVHGLNQFLAGLFGGAAPMIDFVQAACWVMLPLYVLFAQALTHVFRMVNKHRRHLQYAYAVFLVAWMLPSDNLRPVRHEMYRLATAFLKDADKPIRVQELQERAAERAELLALADWARRETPPDALFLTDQSEFRMNARRSILICRDDFRMWYYLAPWALGDWTDRLIEQYQWLQPPLRPDLLYAKVNELADRPEYRGAGVWYVLLPARGGEENLGRGRWVASEGWGKYWRVLKIPASPSAQPRPR